MIRHFGGVKAVRGRVGVDPGLRLDFAVGIMVIGMLTQVPITQTLTTGGCEVLVVEEVEVVEEDDPGKGC